MGQQAPPSRRRESGPSPKCHFSPKPFEKKRRRGPLLLQVVYVQFIDRLIAVCLAPLGLWILVSGVDDLLLDLICFFHWLTRRKNSRLPPEEDLRRKPETTIAIFVPLWHEHRVIGKMIEHNTPAIKYQNYHFFVGAYPNDEATVAVVADLEKRYPNVHLAMVPHDGPTSKADCLNAI